jgi:hypothetical protein
MFMRELEVRPPSAGYGGARPLGKPLATTPE